MIGPIVTRLENWLLNMGITVAANAVDATVEQPARDIIDARNEIVRLNAWVADLQSGMFVNCVYCGHRYGPAETTPVSMADALKAHIRECPKHPMSGLLKATTAASSALRSYQYGNASTELAKEIADACDAAIAEAKK